MNEHAGPACALSFLIVGVFAVLLHDSVSDHLPANPATRDAQNISDKPSTIPKNPAPSIMPDAAGTTRREVVVTSSTVQADPQPLAPYPESTDPLGSCNPGAMVPPKVATPSSDPASARPISPANPSIPAIRTLFTVVRTGEDLRGVATRVYGSADATDGLWRANRDRVSKVNESLSPGMLLRTP